MLGYSGKIRGCAMRITHYKFPRYRPNSGAFHYNNLGGEEQQ